MRRRPAGEHRPLSWRLPVIALVTAFLAGSVAVGGLALVSGGSLRGDYILVRFGRLKARTDQLNAVSSRGVQYWYIPRCYALSPGGGECWTLGLACLHRDGRVQGFANRDVSTYITQKLQQAHFWDMPRWLPGHSFWQDECCTLLISADGHTVSDPGVDAPFDRALGPPKSPAERRFWTLYKALLPLARPNAVDVDQRCSTS